MAKQYTRHNTTGERLRNLSLAIADRGRQRLLGLDIVRALAILVVVFEHTIPYGETDTATAWIYTFAAPDAVLFIMLSGALLMPVGKTGQFLRHRASRVVIPFLFWSIIYALLNYWLFTDSTYWLAQQVRWCWLNETFGEGWFVPALIGVYLIMPVISPWIARASRRAMLYYMVLWLAAMGLPLMTLIMGAKDYSGSIVGPFFNFAGYAVAGYCLMRFQIRRARLPWQIVFVVAAVAIGIVLPIAMSGGNLHSSWGNVIADNLGLPTAALALLIFAYLAPIKSMGAKTDRILRPVVELFARNAWLIYLSHPLIMHYAIPQWCPEMTGTWLVLPVTLFGSLAISLIVKRMPLIRWLLA